MSKLDRIEKITNLAFWCVLSAPSELSNWLLAAVLFSPKKLCLEDILGCASLGGPLLAGMAGGSDLNISCFAKCFVYMEILLSHETRTEVAFLHYPFTHNTSLEVVMSNIKAWWIWPLVRALFLIFHMTVFLLISLQQNRREQRAERGREKILFMKALIPSG